MTLEVIIPGRLDPRGFPRIGASIALPRFSTLVNRTSRRNIQVTEGQGGDSYVYYTGVSREIELGFDEPGFTQAGKRALEKAFRKNAPMRLSLTLTAREALSPSPVMMEAPAQAGSSPPAFDFSHGGKFVGWEVAVSTVSGTRLEGTILDDGRVRLNFPANPPPAPHEVASVDALWFPCLISNATTDFTLDLEQHGQIGISHEYDGIDGAASMSPWVLDTPLTLIRDNPATVHLPSHRRDSL